MHSSEAYCAVTTKMIVIKGAKAEQARRQYLHVHGRLKVKGGASVMPKNMLAYE